MPKIIIERPYESYNQKKNIDIYIDDTKVAKLGINKTVQFEVDAGKHTLMLKDQWPYSNTSIEFDVSNNEDKHFKMTTSKWHNWMVLTDILIITFSFSLLAEAFNITSYSTQLLLVNLPLIILGGFILIYIISKKKHLRLEEIDKGE